MWLSVSKGIQLGIDATQMIPQIGNRPKKKKKKKKEKISHLYKTRLSHTCLSYNKHRLRTVDQQVHQVAVTLQLEDRNKHTVDG